MESGKTILFEQLPEQVQSSISKELKKGITRIYSDWCDNQADRFYVDLNCWLPQNDLKELVKFKMKKLSVFNSYLRIEPHNSYIRLVYTVYKK